MNVMRKKTTNVILCFYHQFKRILSMKKNMKHQVYSSERSRETESTKEMEKISLVISHINSNFIVESMKENCYNDFDYHYEACYKLFNYAK